MAENPAFFCKNAKINLRAPGNFFLLVLETPVNSWLAMNGGTWKMFAWSRSLDLPLIIRPLN